MIFAFAEDGGLEILKDVGEAQGSCEGIDVESGVYLFFDVQGKALKLVFTRPNESGKFLGMTRVQSGEYMLVPDEQADQDSFTLCLREARSLQSNPWFENLDEIKKKFSID